MFFFVFLEMIFCRLSHQLSYCLVKREYLGYHTVIGEEKPKHDGRVYHPFLLPVNVTYI